MPFGSMAKFFSDKGGQQHGGALTWPGTADGFPIRGEYNPQMRDDEYTRIPLVLDYKAKMFHLWDPVQLVEFHQVMDRIVNGWYMQHKRIDRWCDQYGGLLVWLEWAQIYGEQVTGKSPGATNGITVEQQPGIGPFGTAPAGQGGNALYNA